MQKNILYTEFKIIPIKNVDVSHGTQFKYEFLFCIFAFKCIIIAQNMHNFINI